MKIPYIRPTVAMIDLDAMTKNIDFFRKRIPSDIRLMAVVKAGAYGHGAVPVSRHLQSIGINYFAVAFLDEAIELRNGGIESPILVLGYTPDSGIEEAFNYDIAITVFTKEIVDVINETGQRHGKKLKVHIKVDTGMGRVGIFPRDVSSYYNYVKQKPWIEVEGIFSHLASADEQDKTFALSQYKLFMDTLNETNLEDEIPLIHLSNSAALIDLPYLKQNIARLGIAMYGLLPSAEVKASYNELNPVMSLKTTISFLKKLAKGQTVSYGATYKTAKDTVIATLPIGYADGVPRNLSNKGSVLIHGHRAPIIGRVCMDQTMIDVSEISNVAIGDEVIIFGYQFEKHLPLDEHAKLVDTINYELATLIGKRVPRIYLKNGKTIQVVNHLLG